MNIRDFLNGRITSKLSSVLPAYNLPPMQLLGPSPYRIGVKIFGMQSVVVQLQGQDEYPLSITGNVDPVTGNVVESVTPAGPHPGGVYIEYRGCFLANQAIDLNPMTSNSIPLIYPAILELDWFIHGDITTQPWYVYTASIGEPCGCIETLLTDMSVVDLKHIIRKQYRN